MLVSKQYVASALMILCVIVLIWHSRQVIAQLTHIFVCRTSMEPVETLPVNSTVIRIYYGIVCVNSLFDIYSMNMYDLLHFEHKNSVTIIKLLYRATSHR